MQFIKIFIKILQFIQINEYERLTSTNYILDIGSTYAKEWKATIDDCGDESRYIYVSGDENLFTIRSNVSSMMTCPQLSNNTDSIPGT